MSAEPDDKLDAEMRFYLDRAGIRVSDDRLGPMLPIYRELRAMQEILRRPRTAASEPANTYSLATITRSE